MVCKKNIKHFSVPGYDLVCVPKLFKTLKNTVYVHFFSIAKLLPLGIAIDSVEQFFETTGSKEFLSKQCFCARIPAGCSFFCPAGYMMHIVCFNDADVTNKKLNKESVREDTN